MAFEIKNPKLKEKKIFEVKKDIPYASSVKFYANPETNKIMWRRQEHDGKGWYSLYENGKLVGKSRTSFKTPVKEGYYPISLFTETSYHSPSTKQEEGKITKYGTEPYTLDYSDYQPEKVYQLESPVKYEGKDDFGKELSEVQFYKWNYIVLNWIPQSNGKINLQIQHSHKNPYGTGKKVYESKIYSEVEQEQAIKDFKEYVEKHKGES